MTPPETADLVERLLEQSAPPSQFRFRQSKPPERFRSGEETDELLIEAADLIITLQARVRELEGERDELANTIEGAAWLNERERAGRLPIDDNEAALTHEADHPTTPTSPNLDLTALTEIAARGRFFADGNYGAWDDDWAMKLAGDLADAVSTILTRLVAAEARAEKAEAERDEARQTALNQARRAVDALGGTADSHFDRDLGYSEAVSAAISEIEKLGGKWS